jgi:hypothetical protein
MGPQLLRSQSFQVAHLDRGDLVAADRAIEGRAVPLAR